MEHQEAAHLAAHLRQALLEGEFATALELADVVADHAPPGQAEFNRANMHTLIALTLRVLDAGGKADSLADLCAAAEAAQDLDADLVEHVLGTVAVGHLATYMRLPPGAELAARALVATAPSLAHLLHLGPAQVREELERIAADPDHELGPVLAGYLAHLDEVSAHRREEKDHQHASGFVHMAQDAHEYDHPEAYAVLLGELYALGPGEASAVAVSVASTLAGWYANASSKQAWLDADGWERLVIGIVHRPAIARGVILSGVAVPNLLGAVAWTAHHYRQGHDNGCGCDPTLRDALINEAPYHLAFVATVVAAHVVSAYDFHGDPR